MSRRLKNIAYFLSFAGAAYGTMALTRGYMSGKLYEGKEELFGKTVVITGANTGIGKETAKELSKRGARVIMACKDMKKCTVARADIISQTFNKNIDCMECDLASLESIRRFSEELKKKEKFVHVLVNNAGVMWAPKTFTKEGFESHLGINHLGHFYLTYQMVDLLKRSAPSRIINVTCKPYKFASINFSDINSSKDYNEKAAYDQSKLANVMFTDKLAESLSGSKVTVNAVDPGYAFTELQRHSPMFRSSVAGATVTPVVKTFMKTPLMAAQSIIYAVASPDLQETTGKIITELSAGEIEKKAKFDEDAARLWAISERWTNAQDFTQKLNS